MADETASQFIVLWPKNGGQWTVAATAIASVRPWEGDNGESDGSAVLLWNGDVVHVEESTKTITARLGVPLS